MYDLVIKNGTVIDGSGSKRFRNDIAVKDGIIVKLAQNIEEGAEEVIDARGLFVSPGFIDTHTHSDGTVFSDHTTGYNHLEDGVTTELAGQCGTMAAPYYGDYNPACGVSEEEYKEACASYRSFFDYVSGRKLGTNLAFFAGQGNIRGKVMGYGPGEPDEGQLEEMRRLMAEAMEAGCLGFSTGLVYTPSVFAGTKELIEIAKVAKSMGGVYTTHIRGEGLTLIPSIEEALEIGRASGIPVNISHIKVIGHALEGKSQEVIGLLEKNMKDGMVITADQYPFTGGSAPLLSQIPPKYVTHGREQAVKDLKDPHIREKMLYSIMNEPHEFESNIYSAGFEGSLIAGASNTPQFVGKTLSQIAEMTGKTPFDACCDLLIENDGFVQGIYLSQNESDMLAFLSAPWVMAGSDWSDYGAPDDPEKQGGGHPRGMATMVRRLELIRSHGLYTLEQAIHRLTGMPSEVYGLGKRGLLKEGYAADITIFDYDGLKCNADYEHPFRRNDGIKYVLVNGKTAVKDGRFQNVFGGRPVKMER